jgi:carbonic anhydrase/acetyltransferase-like protein (isoleucine patch superfamily)
MDHNLLDFADGVVIGAGAHLSGHTVEGGFLKTGTVTLGRNVTIGVGSVIDIDVAVGADTQVGALSLVPKHSRLPGGAMYVGIPVKRIDTPQDRRPAIVTA